MNTPLRTTAPAARLAPAVTPGSAVTFCFAVTLCFVLAAAATAQNYSTSIVTTGLATPYGIAVAPSGKVYFTELPEPGKSGGKNTVSVYDPATKKVSLVVAGEPAPTNISVTAKGDFYWTCQTVGVILMRTATGTSNVLVKSGLDNCVGVSVTDGGVVYFTQVPTPGKSGAMKGRNTVSMLSGSKVVDISKGEPEPVDVVVDGKGNLYWTCRTAGVILRRAATATSNQKIFSNLNRPTGIAMDTLGALYFTEVPTPGKSGANGGSNAVWKWNPATENLTLVNYGDPDPIDVSASRDGKTIYWTCRTAGVIARAMMTGSGASVLATGTTRPGDTVALSFEATGDAGRSYQAATSLGRGPIAVDQRHIPLGFDPLFVLSVQNMLAPALTGYSGTLDKTGRAAGAVNLPNSPALVGLELYTAFIALDGKAPSGIQTISSAYRMTID